MPLSRSQSAGACSLPPMTTLSPPPQSMSDSSAAEWALGDERHYWIFAIGSMINPISLALRGIRPLSGRSLPALLHGHRLVFQGCSGMASYEPTQSDSDAFHGVLHLIRECELAVLDRIEHGYQRVIHTVTLYDGSTQSAHVYQMTGAKGYGLPSERYLEIIYRGCESYGVDQRYINWLRSHPCVPRTPVDQLIEIATPIQPQPFTPSQLAECDGSDGRDLCIAINGKVLRFAGSPDCEAYERIQADFAGRDVTLLLARMSYEPRCGIPVSDCQMSAVHRKIIENNFVRKCACIASFEWTPVGSVVVEDERPMTPSPLTRPLHSRRNSLLSSIQRNLDCLREFDLDSASSLSQSPPSSSLGFESIDSELESDGMMLDVPRSR